jgi:hypothetical protein
MSYLRRNLALKLLTFDVEVGEYSNRGQRWGRNAELNSTKYNNDMLTDLLRCRKLIRVN